MQCFDRMFRLAKLTFDSFCQYIICFCHLFSGKNYTIYHSCTDLRAFYLCGFLQFHLKNSQLPLIAAISWGGARMGICPCVLAEPFFGSVHTSEAEMQLIPCMFTACIIVIIILIINHTMICSSGFSRNDVNISKTSAH